MWWEKRTVRTHRVAWRLFKGLIPLGLCVLHKCDVPRCVNPDHLFLGTKDDNAKDKIKKGRANNGPRGAQHWKARLNLIQVREILSRKESSIYLAPEYGVSSSAIRRIRQGRSWARARNDIVPRLSSVRSKISTWRLNPPITDLASLKAHTFQVGECWVWMRGHIRNGYGRMRFNKKSELSHRVAWKLFNGPIPPGQMILHRCDVRGCVNPEHLFLGTHSENMQDMSIKERGGMCFGEDHYGSRLTLAQVREIVKYDGPTMNLASKYKVSDTLIRRIRNGTAWARALNEAPSI